MLVLGIESTAHTFGAGLVEDGRIIANVNATYKPNCGGIVPREAAEHHAKVAGEVIAKALQGRKPDAIAYSFGPGIGHCLRIGLVVAKYLGLKFKVPLVPVNHAEAHIEIGLKATGLKDPIVVYVSGGNTQIIGRLGTWRVFGETLDISLGNALDMLARALGLPFPGGPEIEKLAEKGRKLIEMPYVVKGMDLSYSGLFTFARNLIGKEKPEDIAFSFQEHAFAMLVEVAERALAHAGKKELLLVGGVARNRRLTEMLKLMCEQRGAKFAVVPEQFAGDNGAMIAYLGYKKFLEGLAIKPLEAFVRQKARVDENLFK